MLADNYTPIDCHFHDRLEALATTRRRVVVTHEAATESMVSEGVIQDIWTTPTKEEFLRMEDGSEIRLDRILALRRADSGA
jgi:Rho-binding antiterminator